MNKIGFKNFRRFREFEPLEYSNITFLVGRNNSGKSTMVKALLLVLEYLTSDDVAKFSFGSKNLENANIVTFGRAKNKLALPEDTISFDFTLENHQINIVITGNDDLSVVDVESLEIKDNLRGITFLINPQHSTVNLNYNKVKSPAGKVIEDHTRLDFLNSELKKLEKEVEKITKRSSIEYVRLIQEIEKIRKKRNYLAHSSPLSLPTSSKFNITTEYHSVSDMASIIGFAIDEAKNMKLKKFKKLSKKKIKSDKDIKEEYSDYMSFQETGTIIEDSIDEFKQELSNISIYYLAANPAKQSALLNIRDTNNALAQVVHDYHQLVENRIDNDSFRFIKKWMANESGFEIGDSFYIHPRAGEAYEVKIDSDGAVIPLADKGMGSIQAMLLLFRLATIIHKTARLNYKPIVIVEEPEVNLHPALQSKLGDLFLEVHEKYNIDFIVETHSEYLIRKTQLFVKNREYEHESNDNPLSVIYFDKDSLETYLMKFREDGKFENAFGKGFYDEASKLTIDLF